MAQIRAKRACRFREGTVTIHSGHMFAGQQRAAQNNFSRPEEPLYFLKAPRDDNKGPPT